MSFDLNTYLSTKDLPGGPVFIPESHFDSLQPPAVEANVRNEDGSLSVVAVAINLAFIGAIASWILFF